ncbi:hypothetical protein DFP73DRAFT_618461 [Morchella snyderi]|nr:hypothetical protein DFP73DRAFT_618461 [Morchella snyderi]
MTLGSETAALLVHTVNMLNNLASATQPANLTPDERSAALKQLMATVEVAAGLVEVAYVEALTAKQNASGGDVGRIRAETERLRAEAEKVDKETHRAVVETVRTRAEAAKVGKETERVCKEIELAARETLRLKMEAVKVGKEVERSLAEVDRMKAEAGLMGEEVGKVGDKTEISVMDTERSERKVETKAQETGRLNTDVRGINEAVEESVTKREDVEAGRVDREPGELLLEAESQEWDRRVREGDERRRKLMVAVDQVLETAALLVLATNALTHQLSPIQHGLVSTDERNIALRQLLVTVEAAAKLAGAAQTEALAQQNESGTGVVPIRAETERINVEASVRRTVQERGIIEVYTLPVEKSTGPLSRRAKRNQARREGELAGRTLQGTSSEQLMADLGMFGNIARRTMQDIEALQVELQSLRSEKLKAEADARTAVAETGILISTVERVAKDVERLMTQNERVKADPERTNKDLENLKHERQGLSNEVVQVKSEKARIEAGRERLRERIVPHRSGTAFYGWNQEQERREW